VQNGQLALLLLLVDLPSKPLSQHTVPAFMRRIDTRRGVMNTLSEDVYTSMQGPEWTVTGNLKDWEVTGRLG
jgi:hypothetical protein